MLESHLKLTSPHNRRTMNSPLRGESPRRKLKSCSDVGWILYYFHTLCCIHEHRGFLAPLEISWLLLSYTKYHPSSIFADVCFIRITSYIPLYNTRDSCHPYHRVSLKWKNAPLSDFLT